MTAPILKLALKLKVVAICERARSESSSRHDEKLRAGRPRPQSDGRALAPLAIPIAGTPTS